MSRRNLSLQRRCAWWLNECLRLGWDKAQCAGETVLEVQAM